MTLTNLEQPLKMRSIQRNQVRQRLAIAAAVSLMISSCGQDRPSSISPAAGTNAPTEQSANEKTPAVFYKTVEECEADAQKQQAEYTVLKTAFDGGTLASKPTPPPIKEDDCKPQMLAAQQMYQQSAPTYASLADCQAQGLNCEPSAQTTGYYQPRFGGSYFYPFGGRTEYIYVNYQGSQRRLYQPSSVYQSATPGQVVMPSGQVVTKTTGLVNAPRQVTSTSPQRPTGTPAKGAVTGRGSEGFGSTYKSTGSGGK